MNTKSIYAKDGEETLFHFEVSKELTYKEQIRFISGFLEYLGFMAKIKIKPYSRNQLRKRFAKGLPLLFSEKKGES